MPMQQFHLLGEPASFARELEVNTKSDLDELKDLVAAHFAVVEPAGEYRSILVQHSTDAGRDRIPDGEQIPE